jgi:PmbA protein
VNQAYYQALLALAKQEGFEKAEVYASSGERFYVNVFEGQIEDYRVNASFGMGFRGLYQGKMGYAFSEIADDAAMKMLVTQAKENALAIENEDVQFIYDGSGEYESQVESFCPELEAVTPQQKIDAAFAIEKALLAQDSRVTKVMRASVTTASGKRTLCNTEGLYLEQKSNYFVALAYALAMDAGKPYTGGAFKADMRWETLDPQALAKQAADDALSYVGAQQIPSGKYRAVFRNDVVCALMSTFCSVFSAEAAQKGLSLFAGKEGTRVASERVTLVDDPHAKGVIGARVFDGEGVPTRRKNIIENGTLGTLLHNLKTAHKQGVLTTGNAARAGYKSAIGVAPAILRLEPGDQTYDELLKTMGDGLVVTELNGMHAGANPITGDFSLSAKGYLVRDGRVVLPVEQITVSANYFDWLKGIEAVGSDLYMDDDACVLLMPSVLVGEIAVAGK